MSDQDIQKLETAFPALSGQAFAAARKRVREAGQTVLQSEGNAVMKVFPDGRKELVKRIDPPTRVVRGTRIVIRGC
jgi:hypothetical protein